MYYDLGLIKNYSKIPQGEEKADNAIEAMLFLLKNHFVMINDNYEIETMKLIKALKNIGIKYGMKHVDGLDSRYEFSFYFNDDREEQEKKEKLINLYEYYGLRCDDNTGIYAGYIGGKYLSFGLFTPYTEAEQKLKQYVKESLK